MVVLQIDDSFDTIQLFMFLSGKLFLSAAFLLTIFANTQLYSVANFSIDEINCATTTTTTNKRSNQQESTLTAVAMKWRWYGEIEKANRINRRLLIIDTDTSQLEHTQQQRQQ